MKPFSRSAPSQLAWERRHPCRPVSRREFIVQTALASAAAACCGKAALSSSAAELRSAPIVVFSKVYQELHLHFDDAAALTGEAGLAGIDCPVRPAGEILPERVAEDLPRYAEALRKHKLQLPLLTTAITSVSSPNVEQILRAAKRLGVQFYRLGFIERQTGAAVDRQLREIKAQLKELAALNKEIGIGGIMQNHSPSGHTYVAGNLGELFELVKDFDPAQIGAAFDIGHAIIVHGDDWRQHFEKLKSHLKVAYIKDVKREGRWVPFGEGELGRSGYFTLLKQLGYQAPISLHIEFDWADKGKTKTRDALLDALKKSTRVLKTWLADA